MRGVGKMDGWTGVGYRCLDVFKYVNECKKGRMDGWIGSTQRAGDN